LIPEGSDENGDAVLSFTAETEQLDNTMNELLDRMERTVKAAREAWNAKQPLRHQMQVVFQNGARGDIRVYQDEQGNYRDHWTNEVVTPWHPATP
jgi:hypothetical protein